MTVKEPHGAVHDVRYALGRLKELAQQRARASDTTTGSLVADIEDALRKLADPDSDRGALYPNLVRVVIGAVECLLDEKDRTARSEDSLSR